MQGVLLRRTIVHNNCVHQHFNASETEPARALVIKTKPMYLFLNMLFQQTVEARHKDTVPGQGAEDDAQREKSALNKKLTFGQPLMITDGRS